MSIATRRAIVAIHGAVGTGSSPVAGSGNCAVSTSSVPTSTVVRASRSVLPVVFVPLVRDGD